MRKVTPHVLAFRTLTLRSLVSEGQSCREPSPSRCGGVGVPSGWAEGLPSPRKHQSYKCRLRRCF